MSNLLLLTGLFLFEFLLFYFLPISGGKDTLFGIVVSEEVYQTKGLHLLRKYRNGLLLVALFFVLIIVTGNIYFPKSLAVAYIFAGLVMGWWLHTNLRQSWRLRKIETVSRLAATLKPRRLLDYTNIWWELAIILLTIIPFGILIHYYPQLPETIPVHWNASGEADGWQAKSIFSVFFIPFLGLYLQIFLLFTKEDVVKARFRVPAEKAEEIFPLKGISHLANIGILDWSRLMITVLFGAISFLLLSVIATEFMATIITIILWTGVALLLIGLSYYIYQIILANRQIKEIAGQIIFQTSNEEQGWSDGLFYNNADDVAFFIEKPGGVGYTFNFASKRIYLYLAMLGGLIIISTVLPILLNK